PRALWRFLDQIYGNRSRLAPRRREQPGVAWKAVVSIKFFDHLEPVFSELLPDFPGIHAPACPEKHRKEKHKSPRRRGSPPRDGEVSLRRHDGGKVVRSRRSGIRPKSARAVVEHDRPVVMPFSRCQPTIVPKPEKPKPMHDIILRRCSIWPTV